MQFDNVKVTSVEKVVDEELIIQKIVVACIIILIVNFFSQILFLLDQYILHLKIFSELEARIDKLFDYKYFRLYLNLGLILFLLVLGVLDTKYNFLEYVLIVLLTPIVLGLCFIILYCFWYASNWLISVGLGYIEDSGHDGFGEILILLGLTPYLLLLKWLWGKFKNKLYPFHRLVTCGIGGGVAKD